MARVFLTTVLLAILVAVPQAQRQSAAVCSPSLGKAPLDLTANDIDGRPVALSTYRGKILVVNFWATWCVPCRIEIPGFKELYDRYRRRGVEVLGVDVDEPSSRVAPYVREMQINYPILMTDHQQGLLEAFNIDVGLPTTVIVKRDGTICQRRVGYTRKERFEQIIRDLL